MKLNTITDGTWTLISNYLNNNFNKLSVATNKLGEIKLVSFKGVYRSEAELRNLQSSYNVPGDYAFVLVVEDGEVLLKVYYVDMNYNWTTDGGTYNPEVILSDYIEMVALNNISQIDNDIQEYNRQKTENE